MSETTTSRRLRIFLCHSSGDKVPVRKLYKRLSEKGFQPWLDEINLRPGQSWKKEIPKAVRESDVMLICLSPNSVNKKGYVQKEIKFGLGVADEQPEDAIYLIPVKLEECSIPEMLTDWQAVNLYDEGGFDRLLDALEERAEALSIPFRPKSSALPAEATPGANGLTVSPSVLAAAPAPKELSGRFESDQNLVLDFTTTPSLPHRKGNLSARWLSLIFIVTAVAVLMIVAVRLRSADKNDLRPDGSESMQTAPATRLTEVATYYLEHEPADGRVTRTTGFDPLQGKKSYKLHFTPHERGYLYIIAPGTRLQPTTFLTAKPVAKTRTKSNEVKANTDFEFPGGDQWMRVRTELDVTRLTVIFSPEPLRTPDFLASDAGRGLTEAEYQALHALAGPRVKVEPSGDHSVVKASIISEGDRRRPLVFEINIPRK
ncbi:MAG TPA: toll/interleukin-1 receptor domain-containing protein [Blastocatellia bacterium]|nr:toll/interleukin-1 receptor domain-containing protein [Blastocatellia bacterium]